MPASNGGIVGALNVALFPQNPIGFNNGNIWQLDTTNFNDPASPSFYFWKVEEVIAGRTATCNRPIITYRDLGVVNLSVTLSGSVMDLANNAQTDVSVSTPLQIGSVAATQKLYTVLVPLELTAMNLQLSVSRAANAGPLSIVKVRLEGRVEMTAYA